MSSASNSSPAIIELGDDGSESIDNDSCETNAIDTPLSNTPRLSGSSTSSTNGSRRKEISPCFVCGAKAHGYNFDQITCESCKAFFRRNALKSMEKFRCRNNDKCVITATTRKRCKRCRLSKCFKVGMRKEWILTEEEKRVKRRKIERNRLIKQQAQMTIHQQQDGGVESSSSDTTTIQHGSSPTNHSRHQSTTNPVLTLPIPQTLSPPSIRRMYRTPDQQMSGRHICLLEQLSDDYQMITRQHPQPNKLTYRNTIIARTSNVDERLTLVKDLTRELTQMTTSRLLHFFSLIPEFALLNQEEKAHVLTKNMLAVFMFHGALTYDAKNDTFVDRTTNDKPYDAKYLLFVYGPKVYHTFVGLARGLTSVVYQPVAEEQADERSHKLFLLFMIILLFSDGVDAGFEARSIEYQVQLQTNDMTINQVASSSSSIISPNMYLSDKLQKIQQNYIETACRFLRDEFGLTIGRQMFQSLVPLLFDLQQLCSGLANVNLCESAEQVDGSIESSVSRTTTDDSNYQSSLSSTPPLASQFSSTMISGTSHLNELQKENRVPPVPAPSSSSSNRSPTGSNTPSPSASVLSNTTTALHNFHM